jgi:hypothetical protein
MKVLTKMPFIGGSVHCQPGDTISVSIHGKQVLTAEIEEEQVFDTAIVVEELEYLGMEHTGVLYR